jgi:hypothetical protein
MAEAAGPFPTVSGFRFRVFAGSIALTMLIRLTNGALLASAAACAAAPPKTTDNSDGGRFYRRMRDAVLANPSAADWSAVRQAYAANPAYDPFVGVKSLGQRRPIPQNGLHRT